VASSDSEMVGAAAYSADLHEGVVSVTELGASRRAKARMFWIRAGSAISRVPRVKDSGDCAATPTGAMFSLARSRPTGIGCQHGWALGRI
jgi:hypothetical protein